MHRVDDALDLPDVGPIATSYIRPSTVLETDRTGTGVVPDSKRPIEPAGQHPGVKSLSLSLFALPSGLAFGLAIFLWHVWTDNSYLLPYGLAQLLLLTGVISALIAVFRVWGWPTAVAALVLAIAIGFALVGPLELTRPLAEQILKGGSSSLSPCLAELRARFPGQFPEPPGYEVGNVRGTLTQFLGPFLTGFVLAAFAFIRRRNPATVVRGVIPAAAVITYVYLRGPIAWCAPPFGLDGLVAIVLGIVVSLLPLELRRARRGEAAP